MDEAKGKENRATVDASKAKEENLEVAGGKCWRGFWLSALNATGEIFNQFPMKVIVTMKILVRVRIREGKENPRGSLRPLGVTPPPLSGHLFKKRKKGDLDGTLPLPLTFSSTFFLTD